MPKEIKRTFFGLTGTVGNATPTPAPANPSKEQLANPSQVEQILTGWGNLVKSAFVDLDKDLKDLSSQRLVICDGCHMRNGGTCNPNKKDKHVVTGVETRGCGCRLSAKALSPGSVCPLGKW